MSVKIISSKDINIKNRNVKDLIGNMREKGEIEIPKNERRKYNELKQKVEREFRKISKKNEINKSIEQIFKVNIYYKNGKFFNVDAWTSDDKYNKEIINFVNTSINNSNLYNCIDYKEQTEDGEELAGFLEKEFNNVNSDDMYWCFHIDSYGSSLYFPKYDSHNELLFIKFNKKKLEDYFYFDGNLHPFIKELKYQLIKRAAYRDYDEIYRNALINMDTIFRKHIWDFNQISLLKYEGKPNSGVLIYSSKKETIWDVSLELKSIIKLSEHKKIRKLLEVSSNENALLLNENFEVFAFGNIKNGQENYKINFIEELTWKVSKNDNDYIILSKLQPVLPSSDNDDDELIGRLNKSFGCERKYDREKLLNIIKRVKQQKKGTILVIAEDAEEESVRLSSCGIKVNATDIKDEIINLVTSIDGALLIDTKGICHSIGVILDGKAIDTGDSSRGARYNSALRYFEMQKEANKKCMIVVVSEDGYINIIPEYE